jgi:hypothetical protein
MANFRTTSEKLTSELKLGRCQSTAVWMSCASAHTTSFRSKWASHVESQGSELGIEHIVREAFESRGSPTA